MSSGADTQRSLCQCLEYFAKKRQNYASDARAARERASFWDLRGILEGRVFLFLSSSQRPHLARSARERTCIFIRTLKEEGKLRTVLVTEREATSTVRRWIELHTSTIELGYLHRFERLFLTELKVPSAFGCCLYILRRMNSSRGEFGWRGWAISPLRSLSRIKNS